MNSIQDEVVSLDTNEFIFSLRKDASHPACEILLFDKLDQLKIHLALQILLELQHNLNRRGNASRLARGDEGESCHMGLCACSIGVSANLGAARREER